MAGVGPSPKVRKVALGVLLGAVVTFALVGAPRAEREATAPPPPFPLDEFLTYDVRYLGVHCGTMTLTSFVDERNGARIPRIEMVARSSKFFDGVYRVRVRIDSEYSAERGSSLSYHQYGQEKAERKDELWQVDFAAAEVRRTRGAESKTFPLPSQGVVDPLTFLYRMRVLLKDAGEEATLAMMTSRGAVDTVAQVVEKRAVKTPFGKRDVLVVVPRPENEELFSRKGTMEIWFGADEARLPYRVQFDLPFGKLVARLEKVETRAGVNDLLAPEDG